MTQWITPGAGRERGARALGKAWVAVLRHPRRFFGSAVAPGDQVAGLTFAVAAATPYVAVRAALEPVPVAFPGQPVASRLFAAVAAVVLVAPLVLHVAAALETVALAGVAPDRAGVSETVQVVAYATAPCALAGAPVPGLRVGCALYGGALLLVGTSEVHGIGVWRAALAAAAPGALVFGYGYGGFAAGERLLELYLSAP
jgi:hypothetical protein